MSLMSLQGAINLAPRVNARPGPMRFVGVADACSVALETNDVEQTESHTGQRLTVGSLALGKSPTLSLTLKDWTAENLALALYGETIKVPTGTITAEPLPTGLLAGDRVRLDHPFVDDVVLTAGGTPLIEGTDYRVESSRAGIIQFITAPATPVSAAYSYAATEQLGIFSTQPPERWFLLDGINTENGDGAIIQLYKVKFNPVGELGLLHNEGYGELSLTGKVLADLEQPVDSVLGNFGSIVTKTSS